MYCSPGYAAAISYMAEKPPIVPITVLVVILMHSWFSLIRVFFMFLVADRFKYLIKRE